MNIESDGDKTYAYHLQKTIDKGDPFLVEALHDKSIEELQEYIEKLYKEMSHISTNNESMRKNHARSIETAEAIFQAKIYNDSEGATRGMVIG